MPSCCNSSYTSYRVASRRWGTQRRVGHFFCIPGEQSNQSISTERARYVGILDKVRDKAEQLFGEAKEKLGQMTGNESLENAGKRDQLSGEAKEAGHDLRDQAAGAAEDVKDKLSDDKS